MSAKKARKERQIVRKEKASLIADLATDDMKQTYEAIWNAWKTETARADFWQKFAWGSVSLTVVNIAIFVYLAFIRNP